MFAERWSVRWVAGLSRHARVVIASAVLALLASAYLVAFHLPIRADFSALLPENADLVRDLYRLDQRVVAQDTVLVLIESRDPQARAAAAAARVLDRKSVV